MPTIEVWRKLHVTQTMTYPLTQSIETTRRSAVQVWAPMIELSPYDGPFSRDLDRARREWDGEDRIWLMPNLIKSVRWKSKALFWERAVPSEQFNVINVYHVDEGRRMYPQLERPSEWQAGLPRGLYRLWIQAKPRAAQPVSTYRIEVPTFEGDTVGYRFHEFEVKSAATIPLVGVDHDGKVLQLGWPPSGHTPRPVSPDAESQAMYGIPEYEKEVGEAPDDTIAASQKNLRDTGFPTSVKWPKPFDELFFTGGGADRLWHQAQMTRLVGLAESGQEEKAIRDAAEWLNRFSELAEGPLDKAWLLPKALVDAELTLCEVFANYEIEAPDLNELAKSEKLRELMSKKVPVQRVLGWVGYFWWEFYQDLQAGLSIRRCQQCGNVLIGGRPDRKYCNRQENPFCYRKRNTLAQQRSRVKRSQSEKEE